MSKKSKFKVGQKIRAHYGDIFYGRVIDIETERHGSPHYMLEGPNGEKKGVYEHFMQEITLNIVQHDIENLRKKIDTIIAVAIG